MLRVDHVHIVSRFNRGVCDTVHGDLSDSKTRKPCVQIKGNSIYVRGFQERIVSEFDREFLCPTQGCHIRCVDVLMGQKFHFLIGYRLDNRVWQLLVVKNLRIFLVLLAYTADASNAVDVSAD